MERPVARAFRVDEVPVLDGEVLSDPAWKVAEPMTGFWQTRPDEGKPATEKTEVRIVYTDEVLYFGVVCYDREPSKIIVAGSLRDSFLGNSDSFSIILDTYLDKQNGVVFGTISGDTHDTALIGVWSEHVRGQDLSGLLHFVLDQSSTTFHGRHSGARSDGQPSNWTGRRDKSGRRLTRRCRN